MTSAGGDVRLETSGAVAELVLDSAPVNALTTGFLASWNAALDGIGPPAPAGPPVGTGQRVRALVVRSALANTFVAGGDLRLLAAGAPAELKAYVLAVQRAFGRLSELPIPVICAIDGHCLGGGLELALAADIVVATPRSSFGLPEARLGILPAAGGLHRLVRRTGEGTARRLMLTGQRIDGQRAAALGIVNDLAEPGGCLTHSRALARRPGLAAAGRGHGHQGADEHRFGPHHGRRAGRGTGQLGADPRQRRDPRRADRRARAQRRPRPEHRTGSTR